MLNVTPIPAFSDNYLWLISYQNYAVIVDPGDAKPVIDYLEKHQLKLVAILITHHHADHTGGVSELKSRYNARVFGPEDDPVKHLDHTCKQGDNLEIAELSSQFEVLSVPGHTLGHIVYFLPQSASNQSNRLFCGDTVFSGGCGRLFEGSPAQMLDSMKKIMALPADTLLYPAHEYTLDNLKFAKAVEPKNQAIWDYESQVEALRKQNKPSLPTKLSLELSINPFMRFEQAGIISAAQNLSGKNQVASDVEVFTIIRSYKDSF
jgi:hydroxyacylglutathione hydrolase